MRVLVLTREEKPRNRKPSLGQIAGMQLIWHSSFHLFEAPTWAISTKRRQILDRFVDFFFFFLVSSFFVFVFFHPLAILFYCFFFNLFLHPYLSHKQNIVDVYMPSFRFCSTSFSYIFFPLFGFSLCCLWLKADWWKVNNSLVNILNRLLSFLLMLRQLIISPVWEQGKMTSDRATEPFKEKKEKVGSPSTLSSKPIWYNCLRTRIQVLGVFIGREPQK